MDRERIDMDGLNKQRLFVDMDGTLAVFTPVDELETLYQEGYFQNLAPHENVVEAVREIIKNHPEIEVHILSAYLTDSQYALQEKNAWLDKYLPEIDKAHRVFVPCGSDKKDGIPGGIRSDDFLLDDYTRNLNDWQPPARGIKLLNAINHTRGSWQHDRIRYDRKPADLAKGIVSVMRDGEHIFDAKTEEKDVSEEDEIKERENMDGKNTVKFQSAVLSNYEGYVLLAQFDRDKAWDANDYKLYIGKSENYDSQGNYDNSDNSLVFISNNRNMYSFLYGEGWIRSQEEMIDYGAFTVADYAEYAQLKEGVLKQFEDQQIREVKFNIDMDMREQGQESGVSFRYPDWEGQRLNYAERLEAVYWLDRKSDGEGVVTSYHRENGEIRLAEGKTTLDVERRYAKMASDYGSDIPRMTSAEKEFLRNLAKYDIAMHGKQSPILDAYAALSDAAYPSARDYHGDEFTRLSSAAWGLDAADGIDPYRLVVLTSEHFGDRYAAHNIAYNQPMTEEEVRLYNENPNHFLEGVYARMGNAAPQPSNYYGHSLSVGDAVVILAPDARVYNHYVSDFGFVQEMDIASVMTQEQQRSARMGMTVREEYDLLVSLNEAARANGDENLINAVEEQTKERLDFLYDEYRPVFNLAAVREVIIQERDKLQILEAWEEANNVENPIATYVDGIYSVSNEAVRAALNGSPEISAGSYNRDFRILAGERLLAEINNRFERAAREISEGYPHFYRLHASPRPLGDQGQYDFFVQRYERSTTEPGVIPRDIVYVGDSKTAIEVTNHLNAGSEYGEYLEENFELRRQLGMGALMGDVNKWDVSNQSEELTGLRDWRVDRVTRAMEAAGYSLDPIDSSAERGVFNGEYGARMEFNTVYAAEEWLEGVVFDDPEMSDAVEKIMHPERFVLDGLTQQEQQREKEAAMAAREKNTNERSDNVAEQNRIRVAIESTDDYAEPGFHSELVDADIQNEDGSYGKVVDYYRIVSINENGRIAAYNDKVFISAEEARAAAGELPGLEVVSYDDLIHEAEKIISQRAQAQRNEPQLTVLFRDEQNDIEAGINADGDLYLSGSGSGYNLADTIENRRAIERDIQRYTGQQVDLVGDMQEPEMEEDNETISFYVAESMEFENLGEYHEGLTLQEAFEVYDSIPSERLNGGKGIGFTLRDGSMYDGNFALLLGNELQEDVIDEIEHFRNSPLVQQAIKDCKAELDRRNGRVQEQKENSSFIAQYYVVEDLQTRGLLDIHRYSELNQAIAAYAALPNDKMKALGIENTNDLPGSLDIVQCKDGVDTVVEDWQKVERWNNPEVLAAVGQITEGLEQLRNYEPMPNHYYYPDLGLDGTAEELFIQARNGYIDSPEALAKLQEILSNPVEQKMEQAFYVGVLKEIAEDKGERPYVFAQMKKDILDGVNPEEVDLQDGLTLEVMREGDNVLIALRENSEEHDATGAISVPVERFLNMSAEEFAHTANSVYAYSMAIERREAEEERAQEPLVDIYNLSYDDEGYLHFTVEADGYQLEGLYRVLDPANGEDMELVSIDYGDRHPIIERQWDRIADALYDASYDRYNEMIDQRFEHKDRLVQAMALAGYVYNEQTSTKGRHVFDNEKDGRTFVNLQEAARWFDGYMMLADHPLEAQMERILNPEQYESPIPEGDEWYYNDPERGDVMAVHYNPDSNAGGQFVQKYIPYAMFVQAGIESGGSEERFFEILDERADTELVDINTLDFKEAVFHYKETAPDFIRSEGNTMEKLVELASKALEREEDREGIRIGEHQCRKVDEWVDGDTTYVLGNSIEDSGFYYAIVNGNSANIFEYDEQPSREKVEDDFLNLESMRDIDRHEAEYGADGSRAFPHLNDEPEVDEDDAVYILDGEKYLYIQTSDEGYDYTIYDANLKEMDGGQLDNPDLTTVEARDEILALHDMQPARIEESYIEDFEHAVSAVERGEMEVAQSIMKDLLNRNEKEEEQNMNEIDAQTFEQIKENIRNGVDVQELPLENGSSVEVANEEDALFVALRDAGEERTLLGSTAIGAGEFMNMTVQQFNGMLTMLPGQGIQKAEREPEIPHDFMELAERLDQFAYDAHPQEYSESWKWEVGSLANELQAGNVEGMSQWINSAERYLVATNDDAVNSAAIREAHDLLYSLQHLDQYQQYWDRDTEPNAGIPIQEFILDGRTLEGAQIPGRNIPPNTIGHSDRAAVFNAVRDFEDANAIPETEREIHDGTYEDKDFLYMAYDRYVAMSHRNDLAMQPYMERLHDMTANKNMHSYMPLIAEVYYAQQNGLTAEQIDYVLSKADESKFPQGTARNLRHGFEQGLTKEQLDVVLGENQAVQEALIAHLANGHSIEDAIALKGCDLSDYYIISPHLRDGSISREAAQAIVQATNHIKDWNAADFESQRAASVENTRFRFSSIDYEFFAEYLTEAAVNDKAITPELISAIGNQFVEQRETDSLKRFVDTHGGFHSFGAHGEDENKQDRSEDVTKEEEKAAQEGISLPEEKKDPKEQLAQQLEQGVRNVLDSENFKNWLDTSSKMFLNNYSFNNAILVWCQKPDASYTMGYEQWKEYGRNVAKGAEGIKIYVPVIAYEKKEGALWSMIKSNLDKQLRDDPTQPQAVYRIGMSKLEITKSGSNNGLYGLRVNGKEMGIRSEKDMQKFIKHNVLGKVAMYFTVGTVFDVKDTIIPEHLWLKKGFTKAEMVKDEKGKPIKNRRGEYKIVNTPERQAKFQPNLDMRVPEISPEKAAILYDALKAVSERNGIHVYEKARVEDATLKGGADGYFSREFDEENPKGYIVMPTDLEPTKSVSVMIHEMAHSELHGNLTKLAQKMGEDKIPSQMREIQAEAVAYLVGKDFGIESDTSSFKYLAAYTQGFELQALSKSIEVIYNECRQLTSELKAELAVRGLNMDLTEKDSSVMDKEAVQTLSKSYAAYVIEQDNRIADIEKELPDLAEQNKGKDSALSALVAQSLNIKRQREDVTVITEQLKALESADSLAKQQDCIANIEAARNRIEGYKNEFNDLTAHFQEAAQTEQTLKDRFVADPIATIQDMGQNMDYAQLGALSEAQVQYLAKSDYVSRELSPLLRNDPGRFEELACERASQLDKVASKNGMFVEVTFCEQWTDKPIVNTGALLHPKVADTIIKQGEAQIRGLKAQAENVGEYFPYCKCDLMIYQAEKGRIEKAFKTRVDIGDGGQSSLVDHLKQIPSAREFVPAFEKATRERGAKEKVLFNEIARKAPEKEASGTNRAKSSKEWSQEISAVKEAEKAKSEEGRQEKGNPRKGRKSSRKEDRDQ